MRALWDMKAAEDAPTKEREEDQRRRRDGARVQERLRDLGVCVAEFWWQKQYGAYHFTGNPLLGIGQK